MAETVDFLTVVSGPVCSPSHEKSSADIHLNFLGREKYLFKFLSDLGGRLPHGCPTSVHCPLDEVWPLIERWNTAEHGVGVFVTVNPTKGPRRKSEDITSVAALFIDADGETQVTTAVAAIKQGPKPGLIVRTGRGFHAYWRVIDVICDDFKKLQRNMAERFGTDPSVRDLPRVMRLGGTLHLKEEPCLVTVQSCEPKNWRRDELVNALGLEKSPQNQVVNLFNPGNLPPRPPLQGFCEMAAGIIKPLDLGRVESAGMALAHNECLRDRDGWRDQWLFPMTDAARKHPDHECGLKEIFDRVSYASGGSTTDNEHQWDLQLATTPSNPRTLASTFSEARKVGWEAAGCPNSSPQLKCQSSMGVPRAVPVNLQSIPGHRPFVLGTTLLRGEVTVLAAPGGRAKTAVAVAWACSLACGRSLIGEHVFGNAKAVLFISTEDNTPELQRRFIAAAKAHDLSQHDMSRIQLAGVDAGRFTLTLGNEKTPAINEKSIEELGLLVKEVGADVVMLDPLGPLVPIGLNDNGIMGGLLLALKQLAVAGNFALLLIHHFKKGSDGSAESVGGAAALVNHARAALTVESMSNADAELKGVLPSEQWRWIRSVGLKSNLAPPGSATNWLYLSSVVLPNAEPPVYANGDSVQAVVLPPANPTSAHIDAAARLIIEADFIQQIEAKLAAGSPLHANSRGRMRGAPTALTALRDIVMAATGRSVLDAGRIAGQLFNSMVSRGVITEDEVNVGKGKTRKSIVPGPKALKSEREGPQ